MELDNTTRDIMLLDIYGGLLTPRQLSLMKQHLEEDLSLGEIAELEGISRQGVRDCIVKGESVMLRAEEKLGLLAKELRLRALLEEMKRASAEGDASLEGYIAELSDILA